jgi:hypothetical protein
MYAKEKRWETGNIKLNLGNMPVHGCVARDCIYAVERKTTNIFPSPYTGYKITIEYDGEACNHPEYSKTHYDYIDNLTKEYERKCAEKPYSRRSRTQFHNEWIEGVRQFRCPHYQNKQNQPHRDVEPVQIIQLELI